MKGLRFTEWLFIAILILLIGGFVGLFLFEQNRSSGGSAAEIVGQLEFRYRIAERKFSDSVLWDRVNPGDELHNQDWIRTDSYSEAILTLNDGSRVEMSSETMLVLSIEEGKKKIQIENGTVELDLKDSYEISSGNTSIQDVTGQARIRKNDAGLEVEHSGEATYQGSPLPSWAVIKQGKVKARESELRPLSPSNTRRIIQDRSAVVFRWAGPCPCKLVVQPADPSREALVREGITGNDVELSLEEGIYSWYVENENSRSPGRGFRLLKEPELKILQPASGAELSIRGSSGLILISWDSPGLSRKHRLDISGSADMSSVLQSVNTMRNSAVVSLPEGQYYVRVSSESMPGQDYSSEGISSAVVAFKVKPFEKEDQEIAVNLQDDAKKSRPERQPTPTNQATPRIARTYAIFPLPDASVDMSNRESLMFRWTAVGGAEKYLFRLYRDDSILIEKFVTEPYLNFRELTLLDTAWFEWSVEPFFADTRSARGFQHRFQITLSQQLEKPELQE